MKIWMITKWNTLKSNCMFSRVCVSKVVCACVNLRVYVLNAYLRSRSLIPTAFAWWLLLCNVYQNLMHVTVAFNLNMIRHKNSLWQTKTWAQKQTYYSQHMKSRISRPDQQVPVAVVQTVATLWCSAPKFVPNGSSGCWSWSAAAWKAKSRHGEVHGEVVGKAVERSARPWQWWSQVSTSCCSSSGWWRPSTTSAYWFTEGCIVRQYGEITWDASGNSSDVVVDASCTQDLSIFSTGGAAWCRSGATQPAMSSTASCISASCTCTCLLAQCAQTVDCEALTCQSYFTVSRAERSSSESDDASESEFAPGSDSGPESVVLRSAAAPVSSSWSAFSWIRGFHTRLRALINHVETWVKLSPAISVVTEPSVRTKQLQVPTLAWQSLSESLPRSQCYGVRHTKIWEICMEKVYRRCNTYFTGSDGDAIITGPW